MSRTGPSLSILNADLRRFSLQPPAPKNLRSKRCNPRLLNTLPAKMAFCHWTPPILHRSGESTWLPPVSSDFSNGLSLANRTLKTIRTMRQERYVAAGGSTTERQEDAVKMTNSHDQTAVAGYHPASINVKHFSFALASTTRSAYRRLREKCCQSAIILGRSHSASPIVFGARNSPDLSIGRMNAAN